jgi:hypothetical protein
LFNRPIAKIQEKVKAIAHSDFSSDPSIEWADELGDIGKGVTDLALRNRGIGEAVKLTVGALAREGYLNSEAPAELVITASSGSEAKSGKLAAELAQAAEAAAEAAAVEVQVDSEGVGRQRVEQAQELGLTPGKLNLIDKLQESAAEPEDIQVEDWADKSVGEIISQTKKNENASKNSNENASSGKETVPGQVKKTDGAETESENQSGSEASGEAHENNQNSSANSKESHGNPASQDNSSEDTED